MDSKLIDCLRTIVHNDSRSEVEQAWNDLEILENLEPGSENSVYYYNRNYDKLLNYILTDQPITNVDQVPHLLEWFSKFPKTASNSDDISLFLKKSAESFKDKPCLADIIQVISDNEKKYLSTNNENLCKAIIEALSWMNALGDSRKYNDDLIKIREFLKMICRRDDPKLKFECFRTMCIIFLNSNRNENISSALIIVFQLIEEQLWNEHMSVAVTIILKTFKEESKIVKMLSLFCQWLVLPSNNNIEYLSMWLTLFIKGLEKERKDRISKEVAELSLPSIFAKSLTIESFYSINIQNNIVLHLMEGICSLELHHKIMPHVYVFLTTLKNDSINDPKKEAVVYTIKKNTKILLKRFSEHLSDSCSTCGKLANIDLFVNMSTSSYDSQIPEHSEEMEICYPSTSSLGRFDNVKVGLLNLGNTCYMNSVLQALAMTSQFCHEVLLYKSTNDLSDQLVLKNLQNLFALLKYTEKNSLSPTEILRASRPSYFMPGHQQDSSEFLCHLLDVMYEQEKSALIQDNNTDQSNATKLKVEDKEMVEAEEVTAGMISPLTEDGTSLNMYRWTTEENLSEGASLQRKTQSLADFTQGEELAQTQNGLSDSHSDSTDSGIQSVGGEDSTSSSSSSPIAATSLSSTSSPSSYLVHRVFGGELKVTYHCITCNTESDNTDKFRDLQLCFFDNSPLTEAIQVQELINMNYFLPEQLTGDNKYRCDKCEKLCDARRIINILQAPAHLILTLKHFRYDSESRLRTKLRRKVLYNETIQLPVFGRSAETFQLYAAVVHSGYNMDYGHYITYACDARRRWYKFNDSYVSESSVEEFKSLEPPDTPYILFYKRCDDTLEAEMPDFSALSKSLQEYVEYDRRCMEDYRSARTKIRVKNTSRYNNPDIFRSRDGNDDEDDNPPPSNCRDAINIPHPHCLF